MHSHTILRLKAILKALFEKQKGMKASPDFHGKMANVSKGELTRRLAHRLADVLEAGRSCGDQSEEEDTEGTEFGCLHFSNPEPLARKQTFHFYQVSLPK